MQVRHARNLSYSVDKDQVFTVFVLVQDVHNMLVRSRIDDLKQFEAEGYELSKSDDIRVELEGAVPVVGGPIPVVLVRG
jgi:hypothetical protein